MNPSSLIILISAIQLDPVQKIASSSNFGSREEYDVFVLPFAKKFHLCESHLLISDSTVQTTVKENQKQFDAWDEISPKLILTVNQSRCKHIKHNATKSCLQATIDNSNYPRAFKSLVHKVISLIPALLSQNDTVIKEKDLTYADEELTLLECGK